MSKPIPRTNEEIMHAYYYEKIIQQLDRIAELLTKPAPAAPPGAAAVEKKGVRKS